MREGMSAWSAFLATISSNVPSVLSRGSNIGSERRWGRGRGRGEESRRERKGGGIMEGRRELWRKGGNYGGKEGRSEFRGEERREREKPHNLIISTFLLSIHLQAENK